MPWAAPITAIWIGFLGLVIAISLVAKIDRSIVTYSIGRSLPMQEFLISARQDLLDARAEWLKMLGRERRLAALTLEAYERDTRQFFQFLTGHCGGAPGIADIRDLRTTDLRAYLAFRRSGGAGARTLGRG